MYNKAVVWLLVIFWLGQACSRSIQDAEEADLKLTILHINDIHAHFEEVNEYVGKIKNP